MREKSTLSTPFWPSTVSVRPPPESPAVSVPPFFGVATEEVVLVVVEEDEEPHAARALPPAPSRTAPPVYLRKSRRLTPPGLANSRSSPAPRLIMNAPP